MGGFAYGNLRFLIVDDFSSFRSTVNGMLNSLGVAQVLTASNGNEAVEACRARRFDVILCDYDLGIGKNGQRVLEELRHQHLISRETLFVLVSADVSKQAVMAAYDCTPDDYLAKPINMMMLERRIGRLLDYRDIMKPAYKAIDAEDPERAMSILTKIAMDGGKASLPAQKLLGELFIEYGELAKAEKLYTKVLETRPLDWARLGLAHVLQEQGELEAAGEAFEAIASDNPLYLPAYDGMASNWHRRGDNARLQDAIAQSVQVSPMSILRQKNLASVAKRNGDVSTALKALRECVRLGRHSCHGTWDDAYDFGMTAAAAPAAVLSNNSRLPMEAIELLDEAREHFKLDANQKLCNQFLQGRLNFLAKNVAAGIAEINKAETQYAKQNQQIDIDIARVCALKTIGEQERAEELIHSLIQYYAYDQDALERLDELLNEPVSEANRALVAQINREGIELYNRGLFDDAITCFERARTLFPKHAGIQLNIVQALIGKVKAGESVEHAQVAAEEGLAFIATLIDEGHSQYARYKKLQAMMEKSQ